MKNMTSKIFKNIFVSCLLVLFSTIVIIFGVMYNFYGNELMDELKDEIKIVSTGVEKSGIEFLESLNLEDNKRITWINEDGSVKFDTDVTADKMSNHINRQEIQQALEKGTGEAIRNSDTLSERTMYCAKLMKDGTIIRVSTNQYTIWILLLDMIQPLLVMIFITLIISYLVAYLASRKIVQPINQINLEDATANATYPELNPLVEKIRTQNKVISSQIKELKRAQAEFRTITNNMKESLIVVDSHKKILSLNNSARNLFNLPKDAENQYIDDFEIEKIFLDYIKSSLFGEHMSEVIEYNDCWFEVFCNPVCVDERVKGAVVIILDVTEKHQRETLRREFSANVSHELKTPLAAILASAEVVSMENTPKETDIHFSKNIIKETNRLITLVNDIIKLSKLESSSIDIVTEKFDLYEIGQSVVERLQPIAVEKDIKLNLVGESTVLSGVPAVLEEVVYNLVDNSIKYNKPYGKVNITIAPVNGRATVIVEDTGIGISEDNKERIFERFYRVDKSRSKEVGGTGLGLSIVKHGVEYHNGQLKIESEINKGTKITVTL